jgi:glycosyltransferase involved in cell wall biosynthesis
VSVTKTPRLSVGLPVYNGEVYLAEALEDLLGQTYTDLELIISDNASTDETEGICRKYAAMDPRIRYIRQQRNIGLAANHQFVLTVARGALFKWASHDDLYDPRLLEGCVAALDANPDAVLAHSWTAIVDPGSALARPVTYSLNSAATDPVERFRSLLLDDGGDDDYGVIRIEALRRIRPFGSHFHADRTMMAELAVHGRFVHVPDWLYFRRDHPSRASRVQDIRAWCTVFDRRRANPSRHPVARLLAEYVWAYVVAVRDAPLTARQRRACHAELARWLVSRCVPALARPLRAAGAPVVIGAPSIPAPGVVPAELW